MVYGLIICAGKQSRFKSKLPKALMDVKGKSLLQRNIDTMTPYCDKIFAVCSVDNQSYFDGFNKLVIQSGQGSGDAVWKALELLNIQQGDTCFIQWGDCLQNSKTYKFLKEQYQGVTLIPCVYEKSPYVQIIPNGEKLSINFSKFNEPITEGYHDLSLFYCDAFETLQNLRKFREKIYDKDIQHYIHKHANEMEFLDLFNDTDMKAKVCECDFCKDVSFNTVEQFEQLLENDEFEI